MKILKYFSREGFIVIRYLTYFPFFVFNISFDIVHRLTESILQTQFKIKFGLTVLVFG